MNEAAGKTAPITGGVSGLGLAMAHSFAAGMKVASADIEGGELAKAETELLWLVARGLGWRN